MSFLSIYGQDYKYVYSPRAKTAKPGTEEYENLKRDKFLQIKLTEEEEAAIRKASEQERLKSTYMTSYCRDVTDYCSAGGPLAEASEYMKTFTKAYGPLTEKVMPTIPTQRRIFGYMREEFFRMPISTYQDEIGRNGYDVLYKREAMSIEIGKEIQAKMAAKKAQMEKKRAEKLGLN